MSDELTEFGPSSEGPVARAERLKREVGSDIVAAAYLRGEFELPSGESSDYYFDKYLFETKPTILRRVAEMISTTLPDAIDRIAGAGGGGVALAAAVSLETGLPFVILHPGSEHSLRGELHAGERIFILADVVDSGSHVLGAIDVVTSAGGTIAGVLSVIDRDAGAEATIAASGAHYQPLYRLRDLDVGPQAPSLRLDPADLAAAISGRSIPSGGSDPLLDPAAVETLGATLAAAIRDHTPDRVMVWGYSDAVLLAHVVARETGAGLVRGLEDAGLLYVEGTLHSGERVVLLDSGSPRSVRQMIALVRGRDAEAVAVLSATETEASDVDGVPIITAEE